MRSKMVRLLAALSMVVLVSGGCAKKEVMKSEEAVVPRAEAARTTPLTAESTAPREMIAAADPSMAQQGDKSSSASFGFGTVYFDFDKSNLRQDAREVLSRNAEILLKSKPAAKIQIEGHCDERGSAEYNLALGERRAKSALQYLVTLGVKPERLSIISYGKEKPAVQGSDESAWAKNRRAEFIVAK